MDHVAIPLDADHVRALADLVGGLTVATGLAGAERSHPHITLTAHSGEAREAALEAVEEVAAATTPFTVHAHGYGFFTGDRSSELSLHVPVVRTEALAALHRDVCAALADAGADVAPWCGPDLWSPHVTLLDRGLDPLALGEAAAWLAQRHHPSWQIPVDRLAYTGGWAERDRPADVIPLGRRGRLEG